MLSEVFRAYLEKTVASLSLSPLLASQLLLPRWLCVPHLLPQGCWQCWGLGDVELLLMVLWARTRLHMHGHFCRLLFLGQNSGSSLATEQSPSANLPRHRKSHCHCAVQPPTEAGLKNLISASPSQTLKLTPRERKALLDALMTTQGP